MNPNATKIATIRTNVMMLENELNNYCTHEATSFNGYSDYYGGEVYICKDCGKLFISENIEDLIDD
jgi:rubrerythrin